MATYVVTGSARGLGFEMVKNLAAASSKNKIFATSRAESPSAALADVIKSSSGRVHYVQLDVNNEPSIGSAVVAVKAEVKNSGIDVLINNAGVMSMEQGVTGMQTLDSTFATNVSAVHKVTVAFLPLLREGKGKKIVNITSTLGSFGLREIFAGAPAAYKISKAALNMLTVCWAQEFGKEGFIVTAISPGWLKTDLGSQYADLEPDVGAEATLKIVRELKPGDNGAYRNIFIEGFKDTGRNNYDGKNPPW